MARSIVVTAAHKGHPSLLARFFVIYHYISSRQLFLFSARPNSDSDRPQPAVICLLNDSFSLKSQAAVATGWIR